MSNFRLVSTYCSLPSRRCWSRADRAKHHEQLRSVGFRTWIDSAVLKVIRQPNEFAPPSMTLTGHFERVERSIVFSCVSYQSTIAGFTSLASRKQIKHSIDRLLALGMIERLDEPPPPPPAAFTPTEWRTVVALTPPPNWPRSNEKDARCSAITTSVAVKPTIEPSGYSKP